jgi:AcrR family transcriptional regulator
VVTTSGARADQRDAPSSLRDRKKAATRAAIVEAAVRLFAERGYEEATVDDVAAAADVSPATVFRYFGSKDELVFSEARTVPLIAPAIAARPMGESDTEAVRAGLATILTSGEFSNERLRLQQRAVEKSAVLRGAGAGMLEAWRRGIAEGLAHRHGLEAPDPDIELRAALLMTAYVVAIREWIASGQSDPTEALGKVFGRLEGIAVDWASADADRP